MGSIRWHPEKFQAELDEKLERNLDTAAEFLQSDIQQKFPGSPKVNATKKEREASRSRPGEIPHVQLGGLKKSIRWARKGKLTRRVGSTLKPQSGKHSYALYLEYGTKKMAKRPYLRPALTRNRKNLKKLIGAK